MTDFPHRDRYHFHRTRAVMGSGPHHGTGQSVSERRYHYAWHQFRALSQPRTRGIYQRFLENVKDELVTAGTMFPPCDHVFIKRYVPGAVGNWYFWKCNVPDLRCRHCSRLRRSPGNEYRHKKRNKKDKRRQKRADPELLQLEDSDIRAIREFWDIYGGISGVSQYLCLEYKISKKTVSNIVNDKIYTSLVGKN